MVHIFEHFVFIFWAAVALLTFIIGLHIGRWDERKEMALESRKLSTVNTEDNKPNHL